MHVSVLWRPCSMYNHESGRVWAKCRGVALRLWCSCRWCSCLQADVHASLVSSRNTDVYICAANVMVSRGRYCAQEQVMMNVKKTKAQ